MPPRSAARRALPRSRVPHEGMAGCTAAVDGSRTGARVAGRLHVPARGKLPVAAGRLPVACSDDCGSSRTAVRRLLSCRSARPAVESASAERLHARGGPSLWLWPAVCLRAHAHGHAHASECVGQCTGKRSGTRGRAQIAQGARSGSAGPWAVVVVLYCARGGATKSCDQPEARKPMPSRSGEVPQAQRAPPPGGARSRSRTRSSATSITLINIRYTIDFFGWVEREPPESD